MPTVQLNLENWTENCKKGSHLRIVKPNVKPCYVFVHVVSPRLTQFLKRDFKMLAELALFETMRNRETKMGNFV